MFEKEYAQAIEAAKKAGVVIADYFQKNYKVQHKSADQPVTEADHAANQIIHDTILKAFPEDGWLSEETKDDKSRLQKERVWIIDPLDGTKEFINKIHEFAVSIALVIENQPVVGVINNPLTGQLFTTRKGSGTYLNRQQIKVSNKKQLDKACILASRSEIGRGEWHPYAGKFFIQQSGGMAYKMALVASGVADGSFTLQPKNEWDFCAGVLLIKEAGGRVTDVNGDPFTFNKEETLTPNMVYGNSTIHQKLLEMLKDQ